MMKTKERFINRELSWLAFNQRVLHECLDTRKSVFDRLKFSAIYSNNLDEFYMVRVGGLLDQCKAGYTKRDITGLRPAEQLSLIHEKMNDATALQNEITDSLLKNELARLGLVVTRVSELNQDQKDSLKDYFLEMVYPVLTPMAIDMSRPFPLVLNKSLNILFKLKDDEDKFATVQVPSVLKRLVRVESDRHQYVLLEDLITHFCSLLFEGMDILSYGVYRPTRNGDLTIEDEGAEDLLGVIEASLRKRKWGEVVRLEIESDMPGELIKILKREFEVTREMIYPIAGPLDLTFLFHVYSFKQEFEPVIEHEPEVYAVKETLFDDIRKQDIYLHHPYQSFSTVIDFISEAAVDPSVLAIKQVLYRVSGDSPIVKALALAANRGKQVTVLLELMARFDEENNIQWAKELERHGCHVIFGLPGLKTHAKITLIVRKESDGIRRYVHLGTGNYNDKTAKLYTDVGLFTCNEQIAYDASKFFNMLSGYTKESELRKLITAPQSMKPEIIRMIEQETYWSKRGVHSRIIAKMNALVDREVIEALYEASCAGVKIDLIVRGICCLRPGVDGMSENIRVISIIDDFLEHSRIYCFSSNGKHRTFISSADWMPRNLIKRIELLVPIEDETIKETIRRELDLYLKSTEKTRLMLESGEYIGLTSTENQYSAQHQLVEHYH
ncbi:MULTISPECIES: polyphosphate kinase 1 [unclassified Fusibacter]|uniref:polyphosphate kinase 1 n=1 Tax=unclassified Fusibacter TaxID=2624464 RepID=UPI001010102E|nr:MULTISPECIES: polyphosphate kinase 1 [unclassified Fusibacter]MCK8061446.1 polyphosphate kinase 1 [Fusibacter sp. A2]NPE23633.1 polyphosphate kinase 1 [Fusibacter sp. A1]RXV58906.1 polyphosphate kinase 1 [Fusibacter sp. A1]